MAKKLTFYLVLILAVLFIGFSTVLSKRPLSTLNGQGSTSVSQIVTAQTRHFKGKPDAPVTILEFSDFQ